VTSFYETVTRPNPWAQAAEHEPEPVPRSGFQARSSAGDGFTLKLRQQQVQPQEKQLYAATRRGDAAAVARLLAAGADPNALVPKGADALRP
jgi:hypothetical protein